MRSSRILLVALCLGLVGCGGSRKEAEKLASRAEQHLEDGELVEARKLAAEALSSFEGSARVQEVAGRVALERLDPATAVKHFRNAVHLEDHPRRRGLLGRGLVGIGKLDDAADELENALDQKADSAEVLRDAVYVYGRTGRLREATELAKRLMVVDGGSPATLVRIASVHLRANRIEEGRNLVRTLNPDLINSAEDLILLGQVHYELQDGPRAVAALARAAEMAPDTPALHYNLGTARILAEDYRAAKKDFERCLELMPGDPKAMGQMAYCLARIGRRESAMVLIEKALKKAPDDPVLRMLRAELSKHGS